MKHIKQWWPTILGAIGIIANFLLPSVNAYATNHPGQALGSLLLLIVVSAAKERPDAVRSLFGGGSDSQKGSARLGLVAVCCLLSASLLMAGCSASQFEAVLNEVAPAVSTILQIVALIGNKPANISIASKIGADVAGLEKLYSDWQAAQPATKPSVEVDINNGFAVLNQDLGTVFNIAQVSDQNTQAKVTALIGLIQTAVQIAESAIPSNVVTAKVKAAQVKFDAGSFVDSYNKVLVAKTGNPKVDAFTPHHKIHIHGWFVRDITFHVAH